MVDNFYIDTDFLFFLFSLSFLIILDIDLEVELLDQKVSIIFFQKHFIAFIYSLSMFVYTCVHVPRHTCECQDNLQESVPSPAMWVSGTQLESQGVAVSACTQWVLLMAR